MFSQIHEIVFHGKGGYDYHTIYNMPIWLRNFTFQKIKEHYDKESEAYEKAQGSSNQRPKIHKPNYTTKAPSK